MALSALQREKQVNLLLACTTMIKMESILSSHEQQQFEGILGTHEIKLYRFCFAFPSNISRHSSQNYNSEEQQKLQILRAIPSDLLVTVLVIDHKAVLNWTWLVYGSGRLGLIHRTRKRNLCSHKEVKIEHLDGRKKHKLINVVNYEPPFQMLSAAVSKWKLSSIPVSKLNQCI